MAFQNLAHHLDVELLREAYKRTRKDRAAGVDGQTAAEYAVNLEGNLEALVQKLKAGRYRAPAVRRVHIPKGDGSKTRPIGIPTFEDRVLQRGVSMILQAIYEQDFLDCSYGFRPGRSQHQALGVLWKGILSMGGGWVVDVDIRSFFDDLDHGHLRTFLDRRVQDKVLRRLIGKWLNAGVMEEGRLWRPEAGTPQGGGISPLLANIYLHEVVDLWFEEMVKPRLRGRAFMVRFADDIVIVCGVQRDAQRVREALEKRLARFGLTLHPEKTKTLRFEPPHRGNGDDPASCGRPRTFDFLGFTHYWGRSRRGRWVVKRKTAKGRRQRFLREINRWCRNHRHLPVAKQHLTLKRKLDGHFNYYGIIGNAESLERVLFWVHRIWHRWLSRRSQKGWMLWSRFQELLRRFPLPRPRLRPAA